MKQVVRRGLQEVAVDEVPEPVLRPRHLLVRPRYSLISSGTETADLHPEGLLREIADEPAHLRKIWEASKAMGPARTLSEVRAKLSEYGVLGYSGAGVVVDKHTVPDLEAGDRVAFGGQGTGHAETVLAGRNLVVPVPDGVPLQHACFATLGSIALNAVRAAAVELGDVVAVIGLGLVGQLVAQIARAQGGVVVAIDIRPARVELARRLGADHALAADGSVAQAIAALTRGRGADRVIVAAAARSAAPCRQAAEIARARGRVVVVGAVELSFPWSDMYAKELQVSVSRAYGPGSYDPTYEVEGHDYPHAYVPWTENRNLGEFLRLLAAGRVQVQPLITHEFALAEAPQAYATILDPAAGSLAVLLRYDETSAATAARASARKVLVAPAPERRDTLRVAVVGAGQLARWVHLPNLGKARGATLQAVCSASGVRAKSYARRFGAVYCTSDYAQVTSDPEVDVVLITNRHEHHARQALAALRAGKHVFLEKPMALTGEECRLLCRAVEETKRQLTVGFNRRFAPFYLDLKRRLARRVGPAVVNCRINSPGLSGAHWAADPDKGGALLGEGCHFVDLMYWLVGAEPVSVSAYCLPTERKEPIGQNNVAASFRFADGSVGNLTYCTVGSRTSGGERVEVFAQGVGAATEDFKWLTVRARERERQRHWWPQKGYAAQLEAFLAGIRSGTPPEIDARDGARATLACLAMLASARTLRPQDIDLGILDA
jgi:predicted dehydrogenase